MWPLCSGEYIGKAVDDSVGLQVPLAVQFFDGKMIVADGTTGTTAGRVLSFDVPKSAYLGTLTVSCDPCTTHTPDTPDSRLSSAHPTCCSAP